MNAAARLISFATWRICIKIGLVAGGRLGHGVVMARAAQGQWTLPQFITLTGGSVGFQAGIQGSDVVLVFTTRKVSKGC